jgi:hypothetical protein
MFLMKYNSFLFYNSGRYSTATIDSISFNFLNGIINELINLNSTLGSKTGAILVYSIEPLISSYLNNSQGGAYPHVASSTPLYPVPIQFSWALESDDDAFLSQLSSASETVLQLALDDGQNVGGSNQILYPNYALANTSLSQMYGNNVARLQNIRKAWDPENVMYLTGGFKF